MQPTSRLLKLYTELFGPKSDLTYWIVSLKRKKQPKNHRASQHITKWVLLLLNDVYTNCLALVHSLLKIPNKSKQKQTNQPIISQSLQMPFKNYCMANTVLLKINTNLRLAEHFSFSILYLPLPIDII